ncbi:unnamed protein product [Arabidopsis thaliana]|uniref:Uncharacterized protein n=2 Tax=Arabidopsis thaliana TaxID=3702 RepID=A0A654GFR7_ARATH|nr:uncharacterized protein AT2G07642 [Arabidopsis thaliana]ANM62232.1 hypothetical protein AT2G07642 [Arabidopsis thaliana]CAA0413932.1 unnamed protein product [Arabidopsis thaliana]VYS71814.1 unnamed protein product [Arabidopsis thaliana]|eukprot:NP_001336518.1 hypothetical protein AT2G07642 [Arabidopsis thaliana]
MLLGNSARILPPS